MLGWRSSNYVYARGPVSDKEKAKKYGINKKIGGFIQDDKRNTLE
jgi:hypothetical protein